MSDYARIAERKIARGLVLIVVRFAGQRVNTNCHQPNTKSTLSATMKLSAFFLAAVAIAPSVLAAPIDSTVEIAHSEHGLMEKRGLRNGLIYKDGADDVEAPHMKEKRQLRNGLIRANADEDAEEADVKEKRGLRNGLIRANADEDVEEADVKEKRGLRNGLIYKDGADDDEAAHMKEKRQLRNGLIRANADEDVEEAE
ncbi:hypothetical protein D6C98_07435 [Aureobasidium pullulans]|nr:hypothetical protein D6C98_07435 [Aureobasidium pullulans]